MVKLDSCLFIFVSCNIIHCSIVSCGSHGLSAPSCRVHLSIPCLHFVPAPTNSGNEKKHYTELTLLSNSLACIRIWFIFCIIECLLALDAALEKSDFKEPVAALAQGYCCIVSPVVLCHQQDSSHLMCLIFSFKETIFKPSYWLITGFFLCILIEK